MKNPESKIYALFSKQSKFQRNKSGKEKKHMSGKSLKCGYNSWEMLVTEEICKDNG